MDTGLGMKSIQHNSIFILTFQALSVPPGDCYDGAHVARCFISKMQMESGVEMKGINAIGAFDPDILTSEVTNATL